ncbi:MAG TPA: O-antigen ligase family protein [Noviherbaspirillum sp.]|jgi:O-antigen ligase|uniref:O-antigen ligase family protein n=1 Tax=Noviherbaspirillum sp. TaxID=1926288 RepID=UPI002F938312
MITPPLTSPSEVVTNLVGALFVIPIIFGIFIKAPKLVIFGFIGVLFCFSDSTWGELQTSSNIYSRGVGMFYFSLLNLVLITAAVAALIKRLANPAGQPVAPQMNKYFLAFFFLMLGHVVVGLMSGIDLDVILGYGGMLNLLNMMLFMYLVIVAFESDKDVKLLLFTVIALAMARAIFGAIRYFVFDGDSANPYRNFEGLDIKIFFFDISDNYVAALAAFVAAWLLTTPTLRISLFWKVFLLGLLALEIAAVALSFRRSSLIGMALMFVFLFLNLPGRRKIFFAMLAAVALASVAGVFFEQRLQFNTSGGILESLIYDISPGRGGIKDGRFYELYAAAQSMEGHWLFGRGTWGTFYGDFGRLEYHGSNFGFVHSGFGHIVLKAGIVGLVLFVAFLGAFIRYYFKNRKYLTGTALLVADAGFAGFLFWIPTLLIGTPIIEFRTMLLFGFTIAMPFVGVAMQGYQYRRYVAAPQYAPTGQLDARPA